MNERVLEEEQKIRKVVPKRREMIPSLAEGIYSPSSREVFAALGKNEHRDGEQTKPHRGEGHSSRIEHVHLVSDNQSRGGDRHISDRKIAQNLVGAI